MSEPLKGATDLSDGSELAKHVVQGCQGFIDIALQASAQACACDLVFTGADGTTRLDHAIEAYDPGTGALTAWVSVPVLSGTEDTALFLYYGNPTAVDQQDPSAVFGSDADLQMLGAP